MSVGDLALRYSPVRVRGDLPLSTRTDVEKRAARFISRLPLRLRRIGTKMKSSSTRMKTLQSYVEVSGRLGTEETNLQRLEQFPSEQRAHERQHQYRQSLQFPVSICTMEQSRLGPYLGQHLLEEYSLLNGRDVT